MRMMRAEKWEAGAVSHRESMEVTLVTLGEHQECLSAGTEGNLRLFLEAKSCQDFQPGP